MLSKKLLAIILAATWSTPVMADDDYDDYDDDDYRPRSTQVVKKQNHTTNKSVISAQQARNIALKRVGKGRVTDVDFDRHDDDHRGVATYDVDVVTGRTKHEVKINAHTGKIIRIKRDNND